MKERLEVSVKKAGKGVWSSNEGGTASTGRCEQRGVVCEWPLTGLRCPADWRGAGANGCPPEVRIGDPRQGPAPFSEVYIGSYEYRPCLVRVANIGKLPEMSKENTTGDRDVTGAVHQGKRTVMTHYPAHKRPLSWQRGSATSIQRKEGHSYGGHGISPPGLKGTVRAQSSKITRANWRRRQCLCPHRRKMMTGESPSLQTSRAFRDQRVGQGQGVANFAKGQGSGRLKLGNLRCGWSRPTWPGT